MQEFRGVEAQEIRKPEALEYTEIKPESRMTPREARAYWDEQLSNKGEAAPDKSSIDVNESKKENLESSESKPIYIITINESLENDRHPFTGVPFVRKIVEAPNGEKIEGVFPEFESAFDAKIPEDMYLKTDKEQFKECNAQLAEAIEANPELKEKFTPEQLEQIKDGIEDGTAPDGFVWHHDVEAGKLQLVDAEVHAKTGHTGGRAIWGGGSEFR